ncbi:MAG: metallophosphoesterase [Pusillimonas sp.]|nr:metallophosphoesterase [Pusillimonas sp.]
MNLLKPLAEGPIDIIGDIHGEIDALQALLDRLGYSASGSHPQGRRLVFIGDLVDRGPDSPGVIQHVRELVENHGAELILGNHELNLLVDDIKDGSGWFFDERFEQDCENYAPFSRTPESERMDVREFLSRQPVALHRNDIRIVHAAWTSNAINAISKLPLGTVVEAYFEWEERTRRQADAEGVYERYLDAKEKWAKQLEDESDPPPFLDAIADYEAMQQTFNPLKTLTSGVEKRSEEAFFAGHRWRYSDRINWWMTYSDKVPVVIGHYWRLLEKQEAFRTPRYTRLFSNIHPLAWHGKQHNVFCIDYSVGARWRDRKAKQPIETSRFRLAALRWPENRVVFDHGFEAYTK